MNASTFSARHVTVYDKIPSAVLLDGIIQSFLLGFVLGQASKYFSAYKDDGWKKRVYVAIVVLLSLLQTIIEEYKLWQIAVKKVSWAHSHFVWSDIAVNGFISWSCEAFFIRRCWKMTNHNRWVLYPLGTLSVTVLIMNTYGAVITPLVVGKYDRKTNVYHGSASLAKSQIRLIQLERQLDFVSSYWMFGSLAVDIIVASILITSLWRAKTGLKDSDRLVWSVITLTCESAALPCISMIIAVSLRHLNIEINFVIFFVLLAGKLYTYGLLRTLNARDDFRVRLKSQDLGRVTLGQWQWDQGQNETQCHLNSAVDPVSEVSLSVSYMKPPSMKNAKPPKLSDTASISHLSNTACGSEKRSEETDVNDDTFVVVHPLSPQVTFSSPRLDSFERGGSTQRNRMSSRSFQ
ncbi:hypothetical protein BDP27DRAFT_1414120 [Rhodocollybia butyracea]|uniref:DUF6534 domain-containing protein n=1 Tax=Rhodocollybia butyracea TaxID=206335 RepID=A0A9P5Q7M3_9AGAR|nr:hypothetical protein BDP27DRAFT_1414120 [Rhodocollybia butyracea]